MRDRLRRCLILLTAAGVLPEAVVGQDSRFAVGAKFSSIGPGLDLTFGLSRDFNARLNFHYAPRFGLTRNSDIKSATSLLLDWHPGGGQFRLTGGVSRLREEVGPFLTFQGHFVRAYERTEYTRYFGIGWGNPLRAGSRWNYSVDLGAFRGRGGISYSSYGLASSGATAASAPEAPAEDRIRLHSPGWRPVISTGLSFRF